MVEKKKKHWLREWIESIAIALVVALFIRTFIVEAFKIPSGSMKPTLEIKDRIFVNKMTYKFDDIKAGDIVVFRYPKEPKRYFVKRLVACGNDRVQIKDGNIIINGEILREPDIFKNNYYYNAEEYGPQGRAITVPENQYYVLGDNSAFSKDSRYWGFVPRKNIVGKVFLRFWPLWRVGLVR
ncbi:MAG: signal peptidase I [Candidatus Kaelpia aquatica]|nr:signal peptidase I [Candidatus Kaelpia aquatica]